VHQQDDKGADEQIHYVEIQNGVMVYGGYLESGE
jgi:hypothetical protein